MRKLGKTVPLPEKMLNHFPLSQPSDMYLIVLSNLMVTLSYFKDPTPGVPNQEGKGGALPKEL